MSTHVIENVNVVISEKEKKPRAPILPAKFSKFIQFGYFLMQSFKNEDGSFESLDEILFLKNVHMYDNIESQQTFVQSFFDQSKDINKTIRKLIALKKKDDAKAIKLASKPPKPVKEPKPKAVKEPKTKTKTVKEDKPLVAVLPELVSEIVSSPTVTLPSAPPTTPTATTVTTVAKKTKAKKTDSAATVNSTSTSAVTVAATTTTVDSDPAPILLPSSEPKINKNKNKNKNKNNNIDPFVSELVSLANDNATTNATTTTTTTTNNTVKPKRKYNKQSNDAASSTNLPLLENENENEPEPEPEPEPELAVSVISIDGVQFLVDDKNRIFHFDNHTLIGNLSNGAFVPF